MNKITMLSIENITHSIDVWLNGMFSPNAVLLLESWIVWGERDRAFL